MRRIMLIMVLAVIVCSFGVASADLVSMDDSVFGSDAITLDTETSLEWLDINFSTNYSYNQIISEMQSGGIFEAYRFATLNEMKGLWTNAGIDLSSNYANVFTPVNYDGIANLQSFIGVTNIRMSYPLGAGPYTEISTWGLIDPAGSGTSSDSAAGLLWVYTEISEGRWSPSYNFDVDVAREDVGSYLVKTAVPIPPAVWLLGSGLVGLLGIRKKMKKPY